jgi:hypothetical protein
MTHATATVLIWMCSVSALSLVAAAALSLAMSWKWGKLRLAGCGAVALVLFVVSAIIFDRDDTYRWRAAARANTIDAYTKYLADFPTGENVGSARDAIARLRSRALVVQEIVRAGPPADVSPPWTTERFAPPYTLACSDCEPELARNLAGVVHIARRPEEAKTVVFIEVSESKAGQYEGGGAAWSRSVKVHLVDVDDPARRGNASIYASPPTEVGRMNGSSYATGSTYTINSKGTNELNDHNSYPTLLRILLEDVAKPQK